ncbi:hypothetical protein ACSAZL_07820 [Methanosarcina sp. T3]|uniref:hypothetical protein n=1 Tax=Methanosarcina sp. T3 TaxID=3439062 RepID=UPI003F839835
MQGKVEKSLTKLRNVMVIMLLLNKAWKRAERKVRERAWGVGGIVGGIVGEYGFGVILWKRDPLT